jgi:DNA-directed RNA polymerase specialized sigma24 family protein
MTAAEHALMAVPFHGKKLAIFPHEGQPWVAMHPVCKAIGLHISSQRKRLDDPKFSSARMRTTATDGKSYEVLAIPLQKLPGWLFSINARSVKPEVREKLELFQEGCFGALWDYWTKGVAVKCDAPIPPPPPVRPGQAEAVLAPANTVTVPVDEYIGLLKSRIEALERAPRRKRMPPAEREKILALRSQGYRPFEIAALVGRPAASVKNVLDRNR